MENIIIPNKEKVKKLKQKIKSDGKGKLHIIADFDRTLTYSQTIERKKLPSVISILRNGDYLSEEYAQKAHALFDKYHPIEIDPKIPREEKKKAMQKWWNTHSNLLIESKLNKKDLETIAKTGIIRLRKETDKLFDYLSKNEVPIVIMSASGIGNTIPMILEKENVFYNNVHIITNIYEFDKSGRATSVSKPTVHAMNKDETTIHNHLEIYKKIKNRKNIILLGDSLGDLGMITGFEYDNLIKIGFLNPGEEQNLEKYKENFDMIITNDGSFEEINKLIKEITQ